jgi:hypothetical protein
MKNKILIITALLIVFTGFYFYRNHTGTAEVCGWDKIQSNAEMVVCLRDLKSSLLKEREVTFKNYLSLDYPRVDPNFMVPLKNVKEKTASWYKSTDGYRKAHCEARVANYADGSGYFEGIEICEIELLREDINFIKDRIYEIEDYSASLTPNSKAN